MKAKLTHLGEQLRQAIGAAGFETTPQQMIDSLAEAAERIRPGPEGRCIRCGHDGSDGRDFRFGLCDICAFCAEAGCLNSPGKTGRCCLHGGDGETMAEQTARWAREKKGNAAR